jgi:hypothetical protein
VSSQYEGAAGGSLARGRPPAAARARRLARLAARARARASAARTRRRAPSISTARHAKPRRARSTPAARGPAVARGRRATARPARGKARAADRTRSRAWCISGVRATLWPPPPLSPPSRTDWTRLVPPPVLNGHVLSGARRARPSPSPRVNRAPTAPRRAAGMCRADRCEKHASFGAAANGVRLYCASHADRSARTPAATSRWSR